MSRPDEKAAADLEAYRKALTRKPARSRKARIAEGVALYKQATGQPLPDGLKPAELIARITPHLKAAGYVEKELPKVRQVHQCRTGK